MDWVDTVIEDFGRQIGVPDLRLHSDHRLRLAADDGSSIGIISLPEIPLPELVVYLARPITYLNFAHLRSALQVPHFRNAHIWPLQVAASGKEIFIAVRIPQRSISLSTINHSIKLLKNMHASVL